MDGRANDPARSDPAVARVRPMRERLGPEVLAAVDDVDRTLIVSTLALDRSERVRSSVETALTLERWARCTRTPSSR
jgi:hypothetical protein